MLGECSSKVDIGEDFNVDSGFEDSSDEDFVDKGVEGSDDDAVNNEEFDENVDDFDELFDTNVRSTESIKKAKVIKGQSNVPERDMENPEFELGMLFGNAAIFRRPENPILNKKNITFKKNDKWKVRGKCSSPCECQVYASKYRMGKTPCK